MKKEVVLQKVAKAMKKVSTLAGNKGVTSYCFWYGGEPELPLDLKK